MLGRTRNHRALVAVLLVGCGGCAGNRFTDYGLRRLREGPEPRACVPNPERCQAVAHRGFSAVAPENTLAAVRRGIEAGADGIAFDVRVTRDGVPVVIHDRSVDRTTDGAGRVARLVLEQLRRLDAGSWKDARYAGEPVPTLVETLRAIKGTRAQAMIEIKHNGCAREIVAAIREAGMLDSSIVTSFSAAALAHVGAEEPRLRRSLLVVLKPPGTPARKAEALADRARACGADTVDLRFRMITPELVGELRQRGLHVWAWTVNDPDAMATLARWGVQAITTDRPDLLLQCRDALAGPRIACPPQPRP